MFYDFNIPYPTLAADRVGYENLKKIFVQLSKYRRGVVALNHTVVGKVNASQANPILPVEASSDIRQLSRLTVVADDVTHNYGLHSNNPTVNAFDLLAVRTSNEKVFAAACSSYEIDIISLECSSRLPFFLKGSTLGQALDREVYFEISYAAGIRDQNARRQLYNNAKRLVTVTKGKNIIFSSEALNALEIRSPHDLIAFGVSIGLNQAKAKDCITENCRRVLKRSETRRLTHKAVISVVSDKSAEAAKKRKSEADNIQNAKSRKTQ
ncbi:unnamed protein product [Umbelopsis ramanniana]